MVSQEVLIGRDKATKRIEIFTEKKFQNFLFSQSFSIFTFKRKRFMSHNIKIFVQQIYCRFQNCLLKIV